MTEQDYSQQVQNASTGFMQHSTNTCIAYAIFYGIRVLAAAIVRAAYLRKG